jgi:aminopeptidase N
VGLTVYVSSCYLKRRYGVNEWKYRLKKDMERVCELDVHQAPLCPSAFDEENVAFDPLLWVHSHPCDAPEHVRSELVQLKSWIVIHMLERRLGKGNLQKVIHQLLVATCSMELPSGVSTHHFFKVCKKLTNKTELKQFADQWIYRQGVPRFIFSWAFNRKKMVVEFRMRQENTCHRLENSIDALAVQQGLVQDPAILKTFIASHNHFIHE